jgi:hypothetical protein
MNWLVPVFSLYLAVADFHPDAGYMNDPVLETSIDAGVELFGCVGIVSNTTILTNFPSDTWMFAPYQGDFVIDIYVFKGPLKVGITHACYHPIRSNGWDVDGYHGGYDKIYLEVDFNGNNRN